jgi:multimeric flavodoxin WrbA
MGENMKTLIYNGSPKRNGDTAALVHELAAHLDGEVKILSVDDRISPCIDCRYCWEHAGCTIFDEMEVAYPYLEACDNIVIASPIWFSSLSGPLLNMTSRIQTKWAGTYFRKEAVTSKVKNGVIILVGAEPGTEVIPTQTALTIMKYMYVDRPNVIKIYSLNTNNRPAAQDEDALAECRKAAETLNRFREKNEQRYRTVSYVDDIRRETDFS